MKCFSAFAAAVVLASQVAAHCSSQYFQVNEWQLIIIIDHVDTFPVLVANGVAGIQWENVRVTDNWQDLEPVRSLHS